MEGQEILRFQFHWYRINENLIKKIFNSNENGIYKKLVMGEIIFYCSSKFSSKSEDMEM